MRSPNGTKTVRVFVLVRATKHFENSHENSPPRRFRWMIRNKMGTLPSKMSLFANEHKGAAMSFFGRMLDGFSSFGGSDIDWYCDGCHAKLNGQTGFTISGSTWECTECGFINDVTASNVYESHEDYLSSLGVPPCPYCGSTVQGDAPDAKYYFNCNSCGERFRFEGGELVSVFERRAVASRGTCVACQQELDGEFTAAWEDGDNSLAYITCKRCRHKNYLD